MNSLKVLVTQFLMLLFFASGQCQSGYRACYGFDCKAKKWSFSIFTGFSLMGPARDIYDQMISSGLGDLRPAKEGSPEPIAGNVYPKKETGIVWSLETGYTITRRRGLQLSAGKIYHATVEGYQHIGHGNGLELKSDLFAVSLNYVWRTGKGSGGLNAGPLMALHRVRAADPEEYNEHPQITSTWRPGFNVGYTLPIVKGKSFLLTLKVNYSWLPVIEIGPYTSTHTLGIDTPKPIWYMSTFRKSKVDLSTLNFGLSAGWRF